MDQGLADQGLAGAGADYTAQEQPMSALQPLTVVRRYHQAWTTGDFAGAARCLADELAVEVPVNAYDDREQFMAAVTAFGQMAAHVELLAEFGNGDAALLLYDMAVPGLGAMRVAEHFTVTGGLVTRVRQVHDTAGLRAAGFVSPDSPITGMG